MCIQTYLDVLCNDFWVITDGLNEEHLTGETKEVMFCACVWVGVRMYLDTVVEKMVKYELPSILGAIRGIVNLKQTTTINKHTKRQTISTQAFKL